jgi:carbonic anhydrase
MYLGPSHYLEIACTHALRSLVDRIMIAVRGGSKALERAYGPGAKRHPNYRAALIDTSVYLNSAITAFDLRREMNAMALSPARTVFGVYDLDTLVVRGVPDAIAARAVGASGLTLLPAPETADYFDLLTVSIAEAVARKHLA